MQNHTILFHINVKYLAIASRFIYKDVNHNYSGTVERINFVNLGLTAELSYSNIAVRQRKLKVRKSADKAQLIISLKQNDV